jgi:tetratricopeptide (TPR) repeat protein
LASEREDALKKAEKLLRQGKLDLAIAEYARMVEEQPRDWNTRNTLGDLFVRAGQADKAAAQYMQIADHLMHEGFFPRAAAIYKKILKIKPDDETVQLNLGEISATQGLLADAKAHFATVAHRRRTRNDKAGADEMIVRLGSLDPSDFDARTMAARVLEQSGETIAAAMRYREMHADLTEKGRLPEARGALREAVRLNSDDSEGRAELARAAVAERDLEAAKGYLDREIAGSDPALLMALTEIELRSGATESARELLARLLLMDESMRTRIMELAWTLAEVAPDAAFACIDTAVDAALAGHNYMDAAALLQEFATRVPGQIASLLKLVEICVDGRLEAAMYEAQAQLADAYLEAGQGAEARVIAEDLVAREPWEYAHIDRFRRSLVMLNVPDPDALIADRLSGHGPFVATDPFMPPESFGPPEGEVTRPEPVPEPAALPTEEGPVPQALESEPITEQPIPVAFEAVPEEPPPPPPPTRPRQPKPRGAIDIDLTQVLAEMQSMTSAPAPAPAPARPAQPPSVSQNLDDVFNDFRSEVSRQSGADDATEQLKLAQTYLDMGMADEAIAALTSAARSPGCRFEAGAMLGRLYLKRNDLLHAVEWLERAAEAPAPGLNEARELLYDLGAILETSGETSRALAVFLELQADAGEYRDVAARVDRLARVQTGG